MGKLILTAHSWRGYHMLKTKMLLHILHTHESKGLSGNVLIYNPVTNRCKQGKISVCCIVMICKSVAFFFFFYFISAGPHPQKHASVFTTHLMISWNDADPLLVWKLNFCANNTNLCSVRTWPKLIIVKLPNIGQYYPGNLSAPTSTVTFRSHDHLLGKLTASASTDGHKRNTDHDLQALLTFMSVDVQLNSAFYDAIIASIHTREATVRQWTDEWCVLSDALVWM